MKRTKYPEAFKSKVLHQLATSGQTAREIAAEEGITVSQLYRWRRKAGTPLPMAQNRAPGKRRPQDWTHDEKIAVVFESMALTQEQLGGFLRQRGLYRATLDEWRERILRGARAEFEGRPTKSEKRARAADAKRIRVLERELVRKDKALAEAAALLVLQKKIQFLQGDEGDSTEPLSER